MKITETNVGNRRNWRVRRDLAKLLKRRPIAVVCIEVNDRRQVLAKVAKRHGYILFQYPDAARGHSAILVRADAQATNWRHHKINDETFVGREVAGAGKDGTTAEKHIVAVDVTGPRDREVTVAGVHFVPSASHVPAAAKVLAIQAAQSSVWLHQQPLPTDLCGDMNGRSERPEFAPLRKVAQPFSAPSRKGAPIDIHWITQGHALVTAIKTSSDHKAIEANIHWRRDAHA